MITETLRGLKVRVLPSDEDKSFQRLVAKYREANGVDMRSNYPNLSDQEFRRLVLLMPDAVEYYQKRQAEYSQKDRPNGWGTTDPNQHDPSNFRYIVHSIFYPNDYVTSLRGGELKKYQPNSHYLGEHTRDLEGFLKKSMISCSLVDEIHTGTYCQNAGVYHGFILEVPERNIVAIAPFDMGKPWDISDEEEARKQRPQAFKLREETASAQDFFNKGVHPVYNEVAVNGFGEGGQIRISGIYLISDPLLGVPLYEIESRYTQVALNEYSALKKSGFSDADIKRNSKHFRSENFFVEKARDRYKEARDLAELLAVPTVCIPQQMDIRYLRAFNS